jgi:hypothetical protein
MRNLTSAQTRLLIGMIAVPLTIFLNLDVDYSVSKLTIETKSSADFATALTAVGGAFVTAAAALTKNSTKDEDK